MKIKSVSLYFPMSEQGDVNYAVGAREVTAIVPTRNQDGVFCYAVYKKDKDGKEYLDSELFHYSHVSYEIEFFGLDAFPSYVASVPAGNG